MILLALLQSLVYSIIDKLA